MKKLFFLFFAMILAGGVFAQQASLQSKGNGLQRHPSGSAYGTYRSPQSQPSNPIINPVAEPDSRTPDAWITPFNFTQVAGTYTAISGGTSLGTTSLDENIYGPFAIGFNFSYNGTVYTQFSVSANGFIGLGSGTLATSSVPLSGTGSNNVISALGLDLATPATGTPSLSYLLSGSSPSRTLTIQYAGFIRKGVTTDAVNFQIQLKETSNNIVFVYGGFTVPGSTQSTAQVGLRGASSSDFNNRSVTTNSLTAWGSSSAGTLNTSSCRIRSSVYPASGLTYTWAPVVCNNITSFPYNEDFSATLNPCWSSAIISGTYNWVMATTQTYPDQGWTLAPESGTYMASYDSYNATTGSQARLKTAVLDFTTLTVPSVEFYISQDGGYTNGDSVNVQVSTNGGTSWTTLYPAFMRFNSAFSSGPAWTKCTKYLAAYAGTNNVTLGFLVTSRFGNKTAIDNVTVKQGLSHDVGTAGIYAPTKLPKGQTAKWWTYNTDYGPSTETFDVDTKLLVNGTEQVTTTNTITGLTSGSTSVLTGTYNLASYASGSSFTISNLTKLATDQNTANDLLVTPSTRTLTYDTIYAFDDGVGESALGYSSTAGYLGSVFNMTVQDTLTSISIEWGTIAGALAGTNLEIYNMSGGVPTTKFSDIVTGISLTAASSSTWHTYKPSSPIILPVGSYWIGVHQTVGLTGTYIIQYDETGLTSTNMPTGMAFNSATGATGSWLDYGADEGFYVANCIRPNFANIYVPFVANPTAFTGTPVSSSEIDLSWVLNSNSNNVLVAYSTNGTFGTPVTGHVYAANDAIPGGGTVLQYNGSTTFHHTGLTASTIYYYKVWSYSSPNYSGGTTANATTFCGETPSPWTQAFETSTFPPACWASYDNSTGYGWARSTAASGYGTGTGSAEANFATFDVADPFYLESLPFNKGTLASPHLSFDYAYATYSGEVDELDIYYSKDGGASYFLLSAMLGGTSGELNTGGTTTSNFVPTSAQWRTKKLALPIGTNRVLFSGVSAYGNNLYIDNIKTVEGLTDDVAMASIDNIPVALLHGPTIAPKATVWNEGQNTENILVTMTITPGGYTSTKNVNGLIGGDTQQVTFDDWTPGDGGYTMQVCASISPVTDLDNTNNCLSQGVMVTEAATGTWTNGTSASSAHYMGSAVGYVDNTVVPPVGYLYTFGGNTSKTDVARYNESTGTWAAMTSLPVGRVVEASALAGNYIYVIGGSGGVNYTDTVYRYSIAGNSWSNMTVLPVSLAWCKAVAHGSNYIYVAGGVDGSSNIVSSVYVYNISANTWASATAMPGAKFGGAFSCAGDTLVYAGGADDASISSTVYVGAINNSNPSTITWNTAKNHFPGVVSTRTYTKSELQALVATRGTTTNGPSIKGFYPGGGMYRFDAAPWGDHAVIMAGGSESSTWAPVIPGPCYVYKPSIDTWYQQPATPDAVTGAYLGSVDLNNSGTHTYKLILAEGIDTTLSPTTKVQILTEVQAANLSKTLNLTNVRLEGFYAGISNPMNVSYDDQGQHWPDGITDHITVELHDASTYATIIYTAPDVELTTMGTATLTVPSSYGDSYYVTVKHRNSLETVSATPLSFSGTTMNQSFGTPADVFYGNLAAFEDGGYAIYGGDPSQDGLVDSTDMANVDNMSAVSASGYLAEDCNGDGLIDSSDMAIIDNNSAASLGAATP